MRDELISSLRRLIRDELTLLRRLASDRRIASARMPTLKRTGPGASLPVKQTIEPGLKPPHAT